MNASNALFDISLTIFGVARMKGCDYEYEWHDLTRSQVCILVGGDVGGSVPHHGTR